MSNINITNGLQIYTIKNTEDSNLNQMNHINQINPIDINNTFNINEIKKPSIMANYNQDKDDKNKLILKKNISNYYNNNTNNYDFNGTYHYNTQETNMSYMFTDTKSKKKANISSLDNVFKEHIGLQSVMKRDFVSSGNVPIETNESFVPKSMLNNNKGSPFIGRSTNSIMFPEFIISPRKKNNEKLDEFMKIPFSGNSSYKENYNKFEDRYYIQKMSPVIKKDNLENMGKRIMETTNQKSYKNLKNNYRDKGKNYFKQLYSFSNLGINPPQNKDSYLSQYKRAYIHEKLNK